MRIEIPELSVVALMGASGCGKSTFAAKYFKPTEVLSSDRLRGMIADDDMQMDANADAFDVLYYIANKRLDRGNLTVIDATNVQKIARENVLKLAKEQNCFAVAIVFDFPEELCLERNRERTDHQVAGHVIKKQTRDMKQSLRRLKKEGFRYIYVLRTPEEADEVEIIRTKLWNNKKEEHGPFDIIGDVHGCYDELLALLEKLGYTINSTSHMALPPEGRRTIFLGDLCDRGPRNMDVLKLVMNMCKNGTALCVPGNHDVKLVRKLRGSQVTISHGLEKTLEELDKESEAFTKEAMRFLDGLVSHYVLDDGRLVVAHAGLKEKLQGRGSARVREFCLYGETTGESDAFGLPVRLNWAEEYRGKAKVVYGHVPSAEVEFLNNTVCIDTGCVFGGKLTAYRYPEEEIVQQEAKRQYYMPVKPLQSEAKPRGNVLDIQDVMATRPIHTRLHADVPLRAENAVSALEIMSRFAVDPRWLIYLPPTMSPCETSRIENYLEHPLEAFSYYKKHGIGQVVCEQKHMGSRAVVVLCRDKRTAEKRFGVDDGSQGVIYTRTGRHFFEEDGREKEIEILDRLKKVLDKTGFWQAYDTNWVCLDTELMPWSAKAQKLLVDQYAPVGRAGREGLKKAVLALEKAAAQQAMAFNVDEKVSGQNMDVQSVLSAFRRREEALCRYTEAYRKYCWPVESVSDFRVAPFHILATEKEVWNGRNHIEHMAAIEKYMVGEDDIFVATNHVPVSLDDEASVNAAVVWWEELTKAGGEGMVVKPIDFVAMQGRRLLQPAVKCRGKEYLRIIYGPEYLLDGHLERLKKRSLNRKRRLALNEFALGMEALERFVQKDPLYRVHECVFGVLAMESEPVDPRL